MVTDAGWICLDRQFIPPSRFMNRKPHRRELLPTKRYIGNFRFALELNRETVGLIPSWLDRTGSAGGNPDTSRVQPRTSSCAGSRLRVGAAGGPARPGCGHL